MTICPTCGRPMHDVARASAIYEAVKAGKSYKQLGQRYGVTKVRISQIVRQERRRRGEPVALRPPGLSKGELDERNHSIIALYAHGNTSCNQLARQFGLSQQRVHQIVRTAKQMADYKQRFAQEAGSATGSE